MKKKIVVIGGGTFNHVRAHLSLATPAFGETAKKIAKLCEDRFDNLDVELVLTKMADSSSKLVTNDDVSAFVDELIKDNTVKAVVFNVAMCDFSGQIGDVPSAKNAPRLETRQYKDGDGPSIALTPTEKVVKKIRAHRKDIFLVSFKTTSNEPDEAVMFSKGLNLLKETSSNVVLANDIGTYKNMIITPEEGAYQYDTREETLAKLVDMIYYRTHLSFTRSTVVDGTPVPWDDERIYPALRAAVDYCIEKGAYKRFRGVTTGHFAAKVGKGKFLTSIRKTNFNELKNNGLVYVETDGDERVIAHGARPSVGGQSQRIIFQEFDDTDCIVHFHCPMKENAPDKIQVMSQFEWECGSHQCATNTVNGLTKHGNLYAVMLDKHGPNIVFHHSIDPQEVIDFIERNFDLDKSTSGFERVYMDYIGK